TVSISGTCRSTTYTSRGPSRDGGTSPRNCTCTPPTSETTWCSSTASVSRTVVDLARTLPRDAAVVAGDSALRLYPHASEQLSRTLADAKARHGVARARTVVPFLDAGSESVGESLSRVRIAEAGLPRPVLQHEIAAGNGR